MMDDGGRARVLARIAAALGKKIDPSAPIAAADAPAAGATIADPPRDVLALARRFRDELAAVGGEAFFVADESALPAAIAVYADAHALGAATSDPADPGYSLLRADALLADTGTAVVIERSSQRRLAPYLPRACIVVADAHALHAGMTASSLAALHAAARRGDRGEAVLITGPARTADIEKTLVLGAHGPKSLAVMIVGIEPEPVPVP